MTNTAHLTELGHSPDALAQRQADLLALLRQTAPEVLSDNQINIEKLKELLGQERIAPAEHYELNWAGKTEARREIQKTSSHTLRPDANNPAHAQHMLIEGENLEVLRVLQKSYYGKVKMIYIDPPYNTGNDSFVYPDDYSETLDEYQKRTGEKSAEGYLNKQSLWKKKVPRRFVWNLTARIHRSGARWGLWATRQSELSTNPRGGVLCQGGLQDGCGH